MPRVETVVLPDGTPVYIVPKANEDLITVQVHLRSGAAHDVYAGATNFMAELLTRGTTSLSPEEFDDKVESLGCSIRASGGRTSVTLTGVGLREHLHALVGFMADCLHNPSFPEHELETLRGRQLSELSINERDPDWLAGQASNRVCYNGHPYAWPITGTREQMMAIGRDNIIHAYERVIRSHRYIVVAGDVHVEQGVDLFAQLTSGLPSASFDATLPMATMRTGHAVVAVNNEAVQSALRISLPSVDYHNADCSAIQLISTVLGGYTLARLFSVLREQKGYTYGAYCTPSIRHHSQTIDIFTSVGNEHTADTIKTIAEELRAIATERIPDEELEYARQQILGSFARSNETPQQTASLVSTIVSFGLPMDYYEQHVARLQSYQPDDLIPVQQRYFSPDNWVVGCSGIPDVLRSALAEYTAAVEIWDPASPVQQE